jgi:hypothetical protein
MASAFLESDVVADVASLYLSKDVAPPALSTDQ